MEVKECTGRLKEHEQSINTLTLEVQTMQKDMEMGPRVSALVGALQQVAPKVMDQENSVRELYERMGRLEVSRGTGAGVAAAPVLARDVAADDSMPKALARINRLEVEVGRLRVEVEGDADEMPHIDGTELVDTIDSGDATVEGQARLKGARLQRRASAT